jgi:hypothetical protein
MIMNRYPKRAVRRPANGATSPDINGPGAIASEV